MTLAYAHHANVYQTLECYAFGLLIVAGFVSVFALGVLLLRKAAPHIDNWFATHLRAAKWFVWFCWALMGSCALFVLTFGIFALGCALREGM